MKITLPLWVSVSSYIKWVRVRIKHREECEEVCKGLCAAATVCGLLPVEELG